MLYFCTTTFVCAAVDCVLVVMIKGREVVMMREWEHRYKHDAFGFGVALMLLGGWLFVS